MDRAMPRMHFADELGAGEPLLPVGRLQRAVVVHTADQAEWQVADDRGPRRRASKGLSGTDRAARPSGVDQQRVQADDQEFSVAGVPIEIDELTDVRADSHRESLSLDVDCTVRVEEQQILEREQPASSVRGASPVSRVASSPVHIRMRHPGVVFQALPVPLADVVFGGVAGSRSTSLVRRQRVDEDIAESVVPHDNLASIAALQRVHVELEHIGADRPACANPRRVLSSTSFAPPRCAKRIGVGKPKIGRTAGMP